MAINEFEQLTASTSTSFGEFEEHLAILRLKKAKLKDDGK